MKNRTGNNHTYLRGLPLPAVLRNRPETGISDPRYLWPEMCRVIKELRPRWVLGENVANFINMGLHKTLFDLEQAGYAVWTFVLPACAVGAWHERKRTFIVGADVSHAPCFRHRLKGKCGKDKHIPERGISQEEAGRDVLVGGTVGSRLFPHTDPGFNFTLQPGMGGMADGLPTGVDGNLLWGIEPADIPRLAPDKKDRAKRLKTLGNAVVPAQVYPILRYIADIELGRCREWCVFSENGGAGLSSS